MEIDFNKYPLPRRLRHHTTPNLYFPASKQKVLSAYYPPLYEKLCWKEIFLNGTPPNALDIGCGKGKFLLDFAELNPDSNILGIELRKPPVDWLRNLFKGENIPNGSAIWYNIVNGLGFIDSESIDNIFYLFPDPWPKRKHHKRRALNQIVIGEYYRCLKSDGKLFIATDMAEINEHHIKILKDSAGFEFKIIESDTEWHLPVTNKEKFCREKHIPFYRMVCRKRIYSDSDLKSESEF